MPVVMATSPAGQHGIGDVMPHAEEGGRHRGQRIGGEGRQGQRGAEHGILHTHFKGDGLLLHIPESLRIHLVHKLGETETKRVTAQIMQDDHRNGKQEGSHEQLRTIGRDHHTDDQQDGHLGNDGQHHGDLLDLLLEDGMASHAKRDREQHHLDGVEEQTALAPSHIGTQAIASAAGS